MTVDDARRKLRKLVEKAGGIKPLSLRSGVSRSYIGMVLTGDVKPGPKIAGILGVPHDSIVYPEHPTYKRWRERHAADRERVKDAIVRYFRKHKCPIAVHPLSKSVRLSGRTVERILRELKVSGEVEQTGPQHSGRWVPVSKGECVLCGCPK